LSSEEPMEEEVTEHMREASAAEEVAEKRFGVPRRRHAFAIGATPALFDTRARVPRYGFTYPLRPRLG